MNAAMTWATRSFFVFDACIMIYKSAAEWKSAEHKRVLFFGMSGVGKTHVSTVLRNAQSWFHYSVDYRIGTRYMDDHILDNIKREAMQVPLLAGLLKSDSIYIGSNITVGNLELLSAYMGKPGNPELGGIPYGEYKRRQRLHRSAEFQSIRDTADFISRATDIYGYPHFVCDSSGSICEVVDPNGRDDDLLSDLSNQLLLVWIRGDEEHFSKLLERYKMAPKPMYYQEEFLDLHWREFLSMRRVAEDEVDPDEFSCWLYSKALKSRQPKYEAMARNWGVSVDASDVVSIRSEDDCCEMIADALDSRRTSQDGRIAKGV